MQGLHVIWIQADKIRLSWHHVQQRYYGQKDLFLCRTVYGHHSNFLHVGKTWLFGRTLQTLCKLHQWNCCNLPAFKCSHVVLYSSNMLLSPLPHSSRNWPIEAVLLFGQLCIVACSYCINALHCLSKNPSTSINNGLRNYIVHFMLDWGWISRQIFEILLEGLALATEDKSLAISKKKCHGLIWVTRLTPKLQLSLSTSLVWKHRHLCSSENVCENRTHNIQARYENISMKGSWSQRSCKYIVTPHSHTCYCICALLWIWYNAQRPTHIKHKPNYIFQNIYLGYPADEEVV